MTNHCVWNSKLHEAANLHAWYWHKY